MLLKQEFKQLQSQGIPQMCQGSNDDEGLVVQAYNVALSKNDKLTCSISDGSCWVKAFLQDKALLKLEHPEFTIIRVKQHIVANSGKSIGITDFDILCEYSQLIGNPQPVHEAPPMTSSDEKHFLLDPKDIKTKHTSIFEEEANAPVVVAKIEVKEEERKERREMRIPEAKPLNGSVKDYESIKGLFVGLKNWHLLCRVSKVDYQEFKKKNEDKMVRLLTVELMDRSDVKILGYFFYDAADKFQHYIKLNSVYKISEGGIANESYNNSKNDRLSPFKLMFHVNSQFEEVSDVNIIAKSEDSALPLGQVLIKQIYDQEFDIVGILVEVEEPKEFNKDGKTLTRWNWVIVDPMHRKSIHAVIWNDRIKRDAALIGKTVILSRFTLHNYNGSLTLNSKARSGVQAADYPSFQALEEQAMSEHKTYEQLSERRAKEEEGQGSVLKNLRELSVSVETMVSGQTLKTDLDVFINRLMVKKWYYEGCPSCNKTAEKGMSCLCGKYVEQTIPHFIMGVELGDGFGSIFSTAYDEQARKIFWEEEGVIHKLMKYDDNQMKDVVEDYYFQEFKVRIYTKRDQEGRIKHNMGKLASIEPEKATIANLERIRELMGSSGL